MELGTAIYDYSYVVLAEKYELALITEGGKLKAKALKLVRCVSLDEQGSLGRCHC